MSVIVLGRIFLIRLLLIPLVLQPCLLVLGIQLCVDLVDEPKAGGLGGLSELLPCRTDGGKAAIKAKAVEQVDHQQV